MAKPHPRWLLKKKDVGEEENVDNNKVQDSQVTISKTHKVETLEGPAGSTTTPTIPVEKAVPKAKTALLTTRIT